MRRIPLYALQPGMKVARPVHGPEGQVLLQRNMILTRRYITQLKCLGLTFLYIDDGLLDNHDVADVIRDETRYEAVQRVRELVAAVETPNPVSHVLLRTQQAARTVHDIVSDLLEQRHLMVNLVDIRLEDDYLFGHSVNVCILSLITGITLGLKREQLAQLGIGAILHDVGKGLIPHDILYKTGSLTAAEFEIVKKHTTKGYDLLHTIPDGREVALEHHERYDGHGYPSGKKGEEIHLHAQIASICDVYDAVTSARIYRAAHPTHEAVELISASGNHAFSLNLVHKFLQNIAAYPSGSIVELSDKRVGIVIDTPAGFSKYPRVKLLFDQDKQLIKKYTVINTFEHTTLNIRKVLTEEEFAALRGVSI
ncbi:MAG: Cyclic di-GMP phosphodiesterase response regulator RpfG [Firmicutes bacterium]|nr:Cyclic di-GMP phosphodiesterase response regulator RpfG [Bacillota bacterium]MBT9157518.1 Cyclic di-GMP phosphodiesterase response regulator RpfG [Bacillota bacterium]